jgi:hypothetical protein
MKTLLVFLATVVGLWVNPALAVCGSGSMTLPGLNKLLITNYACARSSSDPPGWNELHSGTFVMTATSGPLIEQHEGAGTTETVGTWSTTDFGGVGRVTYSYTGGVTTVFEVQSGGGMPPATYLFCGVGGSAPATLNIYISGSFQAPPSVGVMNANCPAN